MTKLHQLLLLAFLPFTAIFSQNEATPLPDTLTIRKFLDKARSIPYPQSAIGLDSLRQVLEKNGFEKTVIMSDAKFLLGSVFYRSDPERRMTDAIRWTEESLKLRTELFDEEHMYTARAMSNLGQYLAAADPARSMNLHRRSLAVRQKVLPPGHADIAISYIQMSSTLRVLGDLPEALRMAKTGYHIRLKALGEQNAQTQAALNTVGLIYFEMEDYHAALEIFQQLTVLAPSNLTYLNNLGNCYTFLGQHDHAIACYEKILASGQKLEDIPGFATGFYRSFGLAYFEKTEYEKALFYYQKGLDFQSSRFGKENSDAILFMTEVAACHQFLKKYTEALRIVEDAERLTDENHPENQELLGKIGNVKGLALNKLGRFDDAVEVHTKHIEIIKKRAYPQSRLWASYGNRALTKAEGGNFNAALSDMDSAFLFINQVDPTNAAWTKFRVLRNKLSVLRIMIEKDASPRTMDVVDATVTEVEALLPVIQNQQMADQFGRDVHQRIIDNVGMSLALLDWLQPLRSEARCLERAFELSERAKAQRLARVFRETNAKKIAGIPDSILETEQSLRRELAFWETHKARRLDAGTLENDTTILKISSKISDLRMESERLQARLERDFPKYTALKTARSPLKIKELQASLPPDDKTVVVSFFLADAMMSIFVISKNEAHWVSLPYNYSMVDSVHAMLHGLTAYFQAEKEEQTLRLKKFCDAEYLRNARFLHDKLIVPIAPYLRPRVLILPDEELNFLPFEALVASDPDRPDRFQTFDYLLKKHEIRYSWSATLQSELENSRSKTQNQAADTSPTALALAPFAHLDTSYFQKLDWSGTRGLEKYSPEEFSPLPFSAGEAHAANEIFGGEVRYDTAATRAFFLENVARHRILVLPTHADAHESLDELDWIAFAPQPGPVENSLLFAADVYNLDLDADLVLLSGCNTARGRVRYSEGAMSLARAFVGAGARSVVSSFWKTNDAATERSMRLFFQNLKSGKTKSQSLHEAKIALLHPPTRAEQAKYEKLKVDWTRFSHPFFWASLVLWGDAGGL